MKKESIVVIGGGAAGLIAAGRAAEMGADVLLLEKNKYLGRKLLITGKGRCNVTNIGEIEKFIANYAGNGQFLYSAFHRFFTGELTNLLESLGVPLKVERGGRVFPESDKSSDIVRALTLYLNRSGAQVRLEEKVLGIAAQEGRVTGVKTEIGSVNASRVIVATGGKSYPATGSTGDGYKWAQELGHSLVLPRPALVPLNIKEPWVLELQGLALKNIEAVIYRGQKILGREFGELLFTHFGVSGPVILTLSRLVVEANLKDEDLILKINLKPALDEVTLDNRLQRDFQKNQRKQLKNSLDELLPKRLIPAVIALSRIPEEKFVHQVTRSERQKLVKTLQGLEMTVAGPRSLDEAIVTAGGIPLKEVEPKTMESRLVKGLYFAGEILDIDGFTGGYNLQAAFSTGYVAGENAVRSQQSGV